MYVSMEGLCTASASLKGLNCLKELEGRDGMEIGHMNPSLSSAIRCNIVAPAVADRKNRGRTPHAAPGLLDRCCR